MFKSFEKKFIGRKIHILFRLSMAHVRAEMKKLGFGAGDYGFLVILFLDEGLSQEELSRKMRVDKSYTARALAKLEKAGMVERRPDPEEYRIKRVFLGRKAREIEPQFFQILKTWHKVLVKDIESDHLAQLQTGLEHMIKNAEAWLGLLKTEK